MEVVVVERGELHRVLEETRARGEARPRQIGRTRVVVRERGADPLVVEIEVVRHHEQLVRGRELDVAPGVREQLRELGFLGLEVHDVVREGVEQLRGALERTVRAGRDDLRELEELDHRLALGDALRAERHVDVEPETRDQALDHGGDARVHGAPQHEQLAVDEARRDLLDRALHRVEIRVEMLVDRRADHDHDVLGVSHRRRVGRCPQPSGVEDLAQNLVRSRLVEREGAVVHEGDRLRIHVEQRDVETAIGQRQPEREADVPATTHDRGVDGERPAPSSRVRPGRAQSCSMQERVRARPVPAGLRPVPYHRPECRQPSPCDATPAIDYQRLYSFRFRNIDQGARQAVWNEIARQVYRVDGRTRSVCSTPPPAAASSSTRSRQPSAG